MRHHLGIPGDGERVPFASGQHEMDEPVSAALQAFDIKDLLGIIALGLVEPAHPRGVSGQIVQKSAIFRGRRDMAGNGRARHDVSRRVRNRLHDPRAFSESEIHVAQIHEVHRGDGEILNLHRDVATGAPEGQRHARRRAVMRAEAHRVFARASDSDPRPAIVAAAGDPGLVHLGARHFTMEDMRVGRRRNAVAQESGMIGEAAVGLDNDLGRARRTEHALHRQLDAVELGAPDDLPEMRQDDHEPARVRKPHCFDSGVVAKNAGGEPAISDSFPLLFAETRSRQGDCDAIVFASHRDVLPRSTL
jgi:hypothetical protein